MLTSKALELDNVSVREEMINLACRFERHFQIHEANCQGWSDNEELLSIYIKHLKAGTPDSSAGLLTLFTPERLSRYSADIREYYLKNPDSPNLFTLFGILPSTKLEEIQSHLSKRGWAVPDCHREDYWKEMQNDALLARAGDRDAENRIQSYVDELTLTGQVLVDNAVRVLSRVNTLSMKQYLAQKTRSVEQIKLTGGGTTPKRNLCINALIMMRPGDDFPLQCQKYWYTIEELGEIESWAIKALGINYGSEPRIEIRGEIAIIPMVEISDSVNDSTESSKSHSESNEVK